MEKTSAEKSGDAIAHFTGALPGLEHIAAQYRGDDRARAKESTNFMIMIFKTF